MQYTATASDGSTVGFAVETLPQAFARIPDPRRKQGTRYSVAAILSLAVVAILANHTSVLAMAEWAERQTRHVRCALGFRRSATPHRPPITAAWGGAPRPQSPLPSNRCSRHAGRPAPARQPGL